jgi:photosystem II stability/assembly factor-like uncharacterized protein
MSSRLLHLALLLLPAATALAATPQGDDNDHGWHEVATLPSTWVSSLSFASGKIGFAASGAGSVLKTTDRGRTWTAALDLGYPYYWSAVQALNENDVIAVGTIDSASLVEGVLRWSHDGGATWSDDIVIADTGYPFLQSVHFWNSSVGFGVGLGSPNVEFRTTNGGLNLSDWSVGPLDPNGSWFGTQVSALPNGHVRISGITYCTSLDYAATFACQPSIDPTFDGVTFFADDDNGWVGGGGGIGVPVGSPPLFEGWVHRTTDGGATWSGRVLDGPWPINAIVFVNRHDGWAVGGGGSFGGMYVTHDVGKHWDVEFDAGFGPQVCATSEYQIYCAGYDDNATTHIYARDYDDIMGGKFD